MKDLQPLNDNVLLDVSVEATEEKTVSGIIIPDTASKEKPLNGEVIAIGQIENPSIKVGDKVYYKKFSGTELEVEGKKLLLISYEDLLAKVVEA